MEEVREVKITVYIDTNKNTYERTFTSIEEAQEWLEEFYGSLC